METKKQNQSEENKMRADQINFLTDVQVAEFFQVHRSSIWNWVKQGKFPAPLKIGSCRRWKKTDVQNVVIEAEASRQSSMEAVESHD